MIDHQFKERTELSATAVFSKPQRVTLGAQTAEILRASILRGELKPGQKLVERELAEALGVSQGSVREGLRLLEYEGLVTKKANTATYVTQLMKEQIAEIVDVRMELEPLAFCLASRKMTQQNLAELEVLVAEIDKGIANNDYYHLSHSDFQFHGRVWELSGNATLERILTRLCTPLFSYLMIYLSVSQSDLKQRVNSHPVLWEALKNGDEREIRDQVAKHVRNTWFQFVN